MSLRAGDVAELVVEKPAAGGEMLARVDGQVVLVSGAIPGERVTARVDRVAKRVAHARAVDVVDASPDRRDPFSDALCGGCIYSHIAYPRQLAIKREVIADAFARIGKIALPGPVTVAASPEDGYRMRARLHVRGSRCGFFREGTHDICDARATRQLLPTTCDVLDRLMAAARSLGVVEQLREVELSENIDASERVVHLETAQPLELRALESMLRSDGLTQGPYVTDVLTLGDRRLALRRHVLAFFQGNRHLIRDLVTHVIGQVPRGGTVLDLYAGAGLFAIAAAVMRGATVTAVEGDRFAADDLHANAAAAGETIQTRRASVESFVAATPAADTIIVDPPRTGMSPEALEGVLQGRPKTLLYVSCDVATLARDARVAVGRGYTIERVEAFDLFPNTPHVETVVTFARS